MPTEPCTGSFIEQVVAIFKCSSTLSLEEKKEKFLCLIRENSNQEDKLINLKDNLLSLSKDGSLDKDTKKVVHALLSEITNSLNTTKYSYQE